MIDPGDAFLLGYLPQLVRASFGAGPEVTSYLWHVEHLVGDRLHAQPPAPPSEADTCAAWAQAVADRFFARADGHDPARRDAFGLGARVGEAEGLVATGDEPALRQAQARAAAGLPEGSFYAGEPTVAAELETLARVLRGASDGEARRLVGLVARELEAAVRGTPRAMIAVWLKKDISNLTLKYRLAEHLRWRVPVTMVEGRPAPRLIIFDKRVLFVFSDAKALDARPACLRDGTSQQVLTMPGHMLFRGLLSDDVDVLAIDANDDDESPLTIRVPKESHLTFGQLGFDVRADLAAANWSRLGPDEKQTLRKHRYWVMVEGERMRHLVCPDGYGRPRAAVFTTEAALEKFFAQYVTAEQLHELAAAKRLLVFGEDLFPALLRLDVIGAIFNPSGPGRTRALPREMVQMLAEA